jgi:hypothetical protein
MSLVFCIATSGALCEAQFKGVDLVSMVQLIATPEKYDGKTIIVVGFLHLEREGNILYLNKTDYDHAITKNGLWIVRNSKINENIEKLNLHYVLISGTFDARNKGHMSLASGAIKDITGADTWPDTIIRK